MRENSNRSIINIANIKDSINHDNIINIVNYISMKVSGLLDIYPGLLYKHDDLSKWFAEIIEVYMN